MNKNGREKDTDARRWRRYIDDRRRWIINAFPVSIVIIMSVSGSRLHMAAIVVFPLRFMVIFGEGRRHSDTADHCD